MEWNGPSEIGRPGRFGVWTRFRFNKGAIVWPLCGLAIFYAVARAFEAYPVAKHHATYRQGTFVVGTTVQDTWRGEVLSMWADGVIEPAGKAYRHPVERTLGLDWVLAGTTVQALPGRRMPVWFSDVEEAPVVPVSTMPCVPKPEMTLFWLVFAVGLFFAGLRFTYRAQEKRIERRTEVLFDEPR